MTANLQIAPAPDASAPPAPEPRPRKRNLRPRARRTLRALAEIVAPRPPGLQVDLDSVVDVVDMLYGEMPRLLKVAFPLGLWILEIGTWIWGRTLRRFSRLDLAQRERYLRGWVHSRLGFRRDLIKGIKATILFSFYSDPRVHELIGYRPEPRAKVIAAERLTRMKRVDDV